MFGKLTKSQFKYIKSLKQKKYRDENSAFIIEGNKLVREAIESAAELQMILVRSSETFDFDKKNSTYEVGAKDLSILSNMKTAPDVMAVCKFFREEELDYKKTIVALDGVSDPGNLGTIIRICDWFGVEQILCEPGTVELYNPKVVQATMGSLFRVKVVTKKIEDFLLEKPVEMHVYCADMVGENFYHTKCYQPFCLIMGSESHGVRKELLEKSDGVLSIPRFGRAESLNVAVATSVLLSEFRRKQA